MLIINALALIKNTYKIYYSNYFLNKTFLSTFKKN